ncbi:MAG: nucleoside recognition domain-containing protein [Clostridiaceae bacterium]|nr:nucleoside recognition domain-containing protein [Clostridiaceae bacterium]
MTGYIIPCIIALIVLYGAHKDIDVYSAMVRGMKEGIRVCVSIFPAVLTMLVALSMVRASGAIELLVYILAPIFTPLGIPKECLPLALLRPFSGSGALSVGSGIIAQAGADSTAGRIAAVMLGSSETSFYTIAVYSAALGIKDTRHTLPAALCGDLAAFLLSGVAVRLLMR